MNPLTWLAIAGILLLIFVAVTLHKVRQARSSGVQREAQPKKDRVSGGDD